MSGLPQDVLLQLAQLQATVKSLERSLQEHTERVERDIDTLQIQGSERSVKIAKLEVKAGMWGGLAGFATAIVSALLTVMGVDTSKVVATSPSEGSPVPAALERSLPEPNNPQGMLGPVPPGTPKQLPTTLFRAPLPSGPPKREPESEPGPGPEDTDDLATRGS